MNVIKYLYLHTVKIVFWDGHVRGNAKLKFKLQFFVMFRIFIIVPNLSDYLLAKFALQNVDLVWIEDCVHEGYCFDL